jgi:hypothetical protein
MNPDDEALAEYNNRPLLLAQFFNFHRANPLVFREIVKRANEIKAAGWDSYAMRIIVESIRWDFDRRVRVVKATKSDVFKINDHYVPMYVRLLIGRYPEFDGFFELRAANGHGWFSEEERFRRAAAGLEDDDL